MAIAYLGLIALTVLLLISKRGDQPTPAEVVKRRVEKQSRDADPEMALIDGSPLTLYRGSTLTMVVFVTIGAGIWAWDLIAPFLGAPVWYANNYGPVCGAAVGVVVYTLALALMGTVVLQVFTEVDGRGIHRPRWGGREFIPWSSVTQVAVVQVRKLTMLEVRAGQRKISLTMEHFRNPAALVALIHRNVPADRLKDI